MKLDEIYIRDPFIFVEDGVAYLVGSTDPNPFADHATSFLAYKSTDLENFEGPFELFRNDGTFWSDRHYWAPELYKIDGKYCLFASFKSLNNVRATQVLVCDTPLGKYVPSEKPYTPNNMECLDGTYYEENGKKYSFFCNEWQQVFDGTICVGELNDSLTELSNVKTLFKASDAKWPVPFMCNDKKCYVTDGPFIYKTKNNRLIMIWSSPDETGYATGIAYSDSGIYGNWIHLDKPLLSDDKGHGMIFTFNNQLYLTVHKNNSNFGSERPVIYKIKEENDMIHLLEN